MIALILSQSGITISQSIKKATYNYVRQHNETISARDTLIVGSDMLNHNPELIWIEHDEICYKGEMFDIKHTIRNGHITMLIGNYDSIENKLCKLLNNLFNNDNSKNRQENIEPLQYEAIVPQYCICHSCYNIFPKKTAYSLPPVEEHLSIKPDTDVQPPDARLV